MPTVRLRMFSGSREPEVYQEWRREVELVQLMYAMPPEQLGPLVYLSLEAGEGKPRGLLSHISVPNLCTEAGLQEVLKTLDAEYAPVAYETADVAFKRYNQCRRRTGEEMLEYISRLRSAKRQLEASDPGTKFSDTNFAQKLLRSSGLTKLEQRQVLASAGAVWDVDKILSALRLMYDDCHHDDRSRGFLRPAPAAKNKTPEGKPQFKHFPGSPGGKPPDKGGGKGYGKGKGKGKSTNKGKQPYGTFAGDVEEEQDYDEDYDDPGEEEEDEEDGYDVVDEPSEHEDDEWQEEPPADANYSGARGSDGKFKKPKRKEDVKKKAPARTATSQAIGAAIQSASG